MIRQDQNTGSQVGQYGLNPNAYRTNPAGRSAEYSPDPWTVAAGVGLLTTALGGQGGSRSTQTTTQQNLPDWAIPYAQNTMNIGSQFTMNPNYRATTLDRDYSGIRGYSGTPPTSRTSQSQNQSPLGVDYGQVSVPDNLQSSRSMSRGGGRQNSKVLEEQTQLLENPVPATPPTGTPVFIGYGRDYDPTRIYTDRELNALAQSPSGEYNESVYTQLVASQNALKNAQQTASSQGDGTETGDGEGEEAVPFGDTLTPFQAYDRQRFADPGQNTVRGEGILAGRYDQRFGDGGTDPFAAATTAVNKAANYGSTYTGTTGVDPTTGLTRIGSQTPGYRGSLAEQAAPTVFGSENYTSQFLNADGSPKSFLGAPNQGLSSTTFSNANSGLTGPKNYDKNFQNLVNQSINPYQDQVVNQTIKDLDRARRMTQNQIGGQAAKAGAFGGSRQALLEAENNRNYLDRVAAATGQLRQQGFESAANRASQENLQRLGLTAQDLQQTRGLASQGNLAAQGLTAQDAQNVRGLQSQGNLAALNANAGLYQSALGLNAAGDRSAMGYNAGLLGDAMRLDASDLNQRRNIASTEAQFEETATRGAGALNLQGGQALGQLAQAGTADERQRTADLLAAGAGQDLRNQQDLDFIYNEFQRELGYPAEMINLRNAAISPATNSVVTSSSPLYGQNPLLQGLGAGLSTYSLLMD